MTTMTSRQRQTRNATARLANRISDFVPLIWVLVAVSMLVLVLLPLGWLAYISLRAEGGGLTLGNYGAVLSEASYLGPIGNTFIMATSVAILCVLIAAPAAWAVQRTDMPFRDAIRTAILASFAIPPFLGALAWILLASPNAGVLNKAFVGLTGASAGPLNIYSMYGLIFVVTAFQYQIPFVLISNGLAALSSDVEDAANLLGAGTVRTAATIVIPLLMPALLGSFWLAFLDAISAYGPPAMLGIPARIVVIATEIWNLFQYPPKYELGSALALLLLVVTAVVLLAQWRLLRGKGFATLLGKAGTKRPINLGLWRYPLLAFCLLLVACSLVLPLFVVVQASLSKAWGAGLEVTNFTLENYGQILFSEQAKIAVLNTFEIGAIAAIVAALLTAAAAHGSERRLMRGHQVLPMVALAPIVLPGIVLALGLFLAYTRPPLFLYGTIWVLVVANVTKALPVTFTAARAAIRSIHVELDEAARVMGASTLRSFRDVSLPLMKNAIVGGSLIVFVLTLRELSAAVFLSTSKTQVISIRLLNYQQDGLIELAAVMGMVVLVATCLIVAIAQRFLGRGVLDIDT